MRQQIHWTYFDGREDQISFNLQWAGWLTIIKKIKANHQEQPRGRCLLALNIQVTSSLICNPYDIICANEATSFVQRETMLTMIPCIEIPISNHFCCPSKAGSVRIQKMAEVSWATSCCFKALLQKTHTLFTKTP